jgi:hypothetical protein
MRCDLQAIANAKLCQDLPRMSGVRLEFVSERLDSNPQVMQPIGIASTPHGAENLFVCEYLAGTFGQDPQDFVQPHWQVHILTAGADAPTQ